MEKILYQIGKQSPKKKCITVLLLEVKVIPRRTEFYFHQCRAGAVKCRRCLFKALSGVVMGGRDGQECLTIKQCLL